jgi:hypothetical protein
MEQLLGEYYYVEVPKDAGGIELWGNLQPDAIRYITMPSNGKFKSNLISIPPGNWQLVCLSDEITQEQASEIIESLDADDGNIAYTDYVNPESGISFGYATDSFQSLLKSKQLKGRYAILKSNTSTPK